MILCEKRCENDILQMILWALRCANDHMRKNCEKGVVRNTLRPTLWERRYEKDVVGQTLFFVIETTQYSLYVLYIKIWRFTDFWRSVGVCALNNGLFQLYLYLYGTLNLELTIETKIRLKKKGTKPIFLMHPHFWAPME